MLDTSTRRRGSLPLVVAVVIGLVVIVGIYLALRPARGGWSGAARAGCIPLTVAASSEKAALLSQLAAGYNTSGRRFDGKCADVRIVSKASGAAMDALAAGWDTRRDGGPEPQVWTPAASSWVSLPRHAGGRTAGAARHHGRRVAGHHPAG